MGVVKESLGILIGKATRWIYPKCNYCKEVVIDWENSTSYKKKTYHKYCLKEFKKEVYK